MMRNNKINKMLLLIILLATINVTHIKADVAFRGEGNWNEGPNSGSGTGTGKPAIYKCDNNITAYCSVRKGTSISSEVSMYAYDIYGNKINSGIYINKDTLAGTYVGINIYEKKSYSSWATYNLRAEQTYYICTHTYYQTICVDGQKDADGKCINGTKKVKRTTTYTSIYGCNSGDSSVKKTREVNACEESVVWCKNRAEPSSATLTPSYNILYRDSNDIDGKTSGKYNTAEYASTNRICEPATSSTSGTYKRKSQTCNFYYNREKACINVINGKVRYINNNEECNKEDEYTINYSANYWKYFVPLNANSVEDFSLIMQSNGVKQHSEICKNIIDNYNNYKDLLIDQNGQPFASNDNKQSAKAKVEKGCYYQTRITIPIEQKFYNETTSGNFNGFNFYYKPIDIGNPFPNEINKSSLWYEWNTNKKATPDISKSYNKMTYSAQINNVNEIRKYNTKDNPYTSWYNMYVNGTSKFIDKRGIVKRYVDRKSYYQLGCGPSNNSEYTDSGIKNVFYQKECKR